MSASIEDCLNRGVDIHYAVNITGHGWRKLMRASDPFAYVVERVPDASAGLRVHPGRSADVDDAEAYGNFNMGAGFAIYVPEKDVADSAGRGEAFPFARSSPGTSKQCRQARRHRPKGLEYSATRSASVKRVGPSVFVFANEVGLERLIRAQAMPLLTKRLD